jgi:misacylated tRNA(Ala) deacylase
MSLVRLVATASKVPLELCRDDALLKTAGLVPYSSTLERWFFAKSPDGQLSWFSLPDLLARDSGERIAVADTRKGESPDSVLHVVAAGIVMPAVGENVALEIDWARRYALMRLHTALHVMSCVVVAPVTGGNIAPDKARLDFDIDMSLLDAERISRETNALIERGVATETVWITDDELVARPELVKTMSVQPPRGSGRVRLLRIPGIDLQPCGGTHVANIGEIGAIRVLRIRSEGRRNRRVEIALV